MSNINDLLVKIEWKDMIIEDYCSYEVAKLLKEKGFDEPTWTRYEDNNEVIFGDKYNWNNSPMGQISAPTLQMAMKWLREVHGLYIEVSLSCDREDKNAKIFDASIFNVQNQRYKKLSSIQGYEEAGEAAIKYCLKNLI